MVNGKIILTVKWTFRHKGFSIVLQSLGNLDGASIEFLFVIIINIRMISFLQHWE